MTVAGKNGESVPLSELVNVSQKVQDKTIYHKNLKPVVYVIGDVAGKLESPVYAILKMKDKIASLRLPEGYAMQQYSATQPWLEDKYCYEMGWRMAHHL